jgi:hypothetical protein
MKERERLGIEGIIYLGGCKLKSMLTDAFLRCARFLRLATPACQKHVQKYILRCMLEVCPGTHSAVDV